MQHDVQPSNTQIACHSILRNMISLSQKVGFAGSAVLMTKNRDEILLVPAFKL